MSQNKLIILDRDGVINRDLPNYVKHIDEWETIAGSIEAIADLYHSGYTVVVATNQQGIGKGLYSKETLKQLHQHLHDQLAQYEAKIAAIYYCPHLALDECDCRKPKPGMYQQAISQFKANASETYVVGDALRDLQAALACGAQPILVRTGKGEITQQQLLDAQNAQLVDTPVYNDLSHFVKQLIKSH